MEAVAEVYQAGANIYFILSNVASPSDNSELKHACPTGHLTFSGLADSNFEVPRVTLYLHDMVTVTFSWVPCQTWKTTREMF